MSLFESMPQGTLSNLARTNAYMYISFFKSLESPRWDSNPFLSRHFQVVCQSNCMCISSNWHYLRKSKSCPKANAAINSFLLTRLSIFTHYCPIFRISIAGFSNSGMKNEQTYIIKLSHSYVKSSAVTIGTYMPYVFFCHS